MSLEQCRAILITIQHGAHYSFELWSRAPPTRIHFHLKDPHCVCLCNANWALTLIPLVRPSILTQKVNLLEE